MAALDKAGHETRLLDLHAIDFDPVMSAEERARYHDAGANETGIAEHLEALRWCEALVFIYPTWWYGLPAILKGWLDRVWVPHATFRMPEGNRPIGRIMTNIRVIAAISTLGAPWWWWELVMFAPGRRTLLTGLRVLCHPRCKTLWLALHRIDTAGPVERGRFLDRVEQRMARLA
jgi:putative NADPH-quinone reductase